MKKLPKINTSKLLKAALPYILVGLMATKLGQAYRMASGGDVLDRIFGAFLKIGEAFTNPLPSLHPFDLLVGAACGALLWFIVYQKSKNARKYRRGAEYGTARWGNAKDIEPFIDPDFSQNILLSETERLTLGKIADPEKRNVNLNVLVIGGSGSGKTRYHIKPNAEYAKHDRAEFVRVVQEAQSSQQTAEVKKQRTRLATAKQRVSELEVLLCKIYEDNILGKLSDSRYATLDAQYEKEQTELTAEISVLEKAIKSYEKHEKDADRFIALIDKYENFDKLTIAMLNEFIEKILVHERDRKGSIQTTQEVEIYFNFVGRFVPPAFGEVELTPEELEEIRKREERKDRLHQNYLKRKANGKQKEYEERTKAKKKAEIEARKQAIRTEDIARGVFIPVSSLPQLGPRKGA